MAGLFVERGYSIPPGFGPALKSMDIDRKSCASLEPRSVAFTPSKNEGAMPAKQTRESIEAELGLPTFYRSKPIVERMAALGYDQAAIDHVKTWLDVQNSIWTDRKSVV